MAKKLLSALLTLVMLGCMMSVGFAETATEGETPLVVGYSYFSQKFSPFFADTAYDQDVVSVVCGNGMLTLDRQAGIVYNAIEGETRNFNGTDYTYTGPADVSVVKNEDGTTTYTIKIREDLKFSDGTPVTADDMIFSYYVYLDPTYVGSTTLGSYGIKGVKDYQTQTTSDVYSKYDDMAKAIVAAGAGYTVAEGDAFTQEQYDAYQALVAQQKTEWSDACMMIVNYVYDNYGADYGESIIGKTADQFTDAEKIAFGMAMWGFGGVADGVLTGSDGVATPLADVTIDNYFNAAFAGYAGDSATFATKELDGVGVATITDPTTAFISAQAASDETMAGGVPNISGITKLDNQTVQIVTENFQAPAVYSIAGINAISIDYYGDRAQYNYENNQFGHPFGDLSMIQAKTTEPFGWGPYKFVKYENKVIYFEANEYYYKGAPKIKSMQWKEGADVDKIG